METVTVSHDFQIVIPRSIREQCGLQPGQRCRSFSRGDRIELAPLKPMKEMRGFVRGIDTDIVREEDRL